MKIAFIGTHGTGKTTLAHELVTNLKKRGIDAGIMSEVARQCPLPIKEDTTKKSQIWIILTQIIKEIEAEEKFEVVVCDRSALDGYCYYTSKFGRSKALESLVIQHLKTYDHLIRVPIQEGFLKKDKIRSTSLEFQKRVDAEFDKILKVLKIDHSILKEKTIKSLISNF